jgi:hypothetical protein
MSGQSLMEIILDTEKFFKDWRNLEKKEQERQIKGFHKAAQLLKNKIVEYTPVGKPELWNWPAHKDYVPGHLKASWNLELSGKEATISNDAPYAVRVEYGWSSQAPNGMLRRAVAEWPKILQNAVKS